MASWGARWSTAISLPWIALSIRSDVATALHGEHFYLINSLFFTIVYDVLWWTAIGFVFGWAYPLRRGRTGLTEATLLATVIAVPLFVIRFFSRAGDAIGVRDDGPDRGRAGRRRASSACCRLRAAATRGSRTRRVS